MDYRQQLASVLQENFLFDGTIAENVGYAKPGATLEEIKEACRIAHCDEFISQFPEGYDTVVGERGIKLSGGQRQRVSIARAILANPRILILDEATSSLDSESEQMIQDGLRRLRSGPHDVRDRAPAVDDPQRRPDPRARSGRDRRARHARGAARAQRPLPAALRQAVQVRGRSVHQPRRGLSRPSPTSPSCLCRGYQKRDKSPLNNQGTEKPTYVVMKKPSGHRLSWGKNLRVPLGVKGGSRARRGVDSPGGRGGMPPSPFVRRAALPGRRGRSGTSG